MSFITIDATACKGDGMCVTVCPLGALELGPDGLPRETADARCVGCGHCVAVCPHAALTNDMVDAAGCLPFPSSLPDAEAVRGLMLSRRSVRTFKDMPVPQAVIAGLLDTARYAPTAVNSQQVAWTACVDPATVREVAGMVVDWMRGQDYFPPMIAAWDAGRDMVLRGAPAIVVAHAPTDYNWKTEDCAIALTYLELAAAASGLGACWAGLLTRAVATVPALAARVGIPDGSVACGGLMLGYPALRYQRVPPRNAARVTWF
ncbi:MAG: nitroreductase family protein [Desulfovibrionaceae bacterium]